MMPVVHRTTSTFIINDGSSAPHHLYFLLLMMPVVHRTTSTFIINDASSAPHHLYFYY